MKTLKRFLSIILVALLFSISGCSDKTYTVIQDSSNTNSTSTSSKLDTTDNFFLKGLTELGFEYAVVNEKDNDSKESKVIVSDVSFFDAKNDISTIDINDEMITIYEFTSEEDALKSKENVDSGGLQIKSDNLSINISWASAPHFYQRNKLIVLYVGESTPLKDCIQKIMGPQFAGQP
jgi:PBP1b-binding outer membrane lipoprotein LpoB